MLERAKSLFEYIQLNSKLFDKYRKYFEVEYLFRVTAPDNNLFNLVVELKVFYRLILLCDVIVEKKLINFLHDI